MASIVDAVNGRGRYRRRRQTTTTPTPAPRRVSEPVDEKQNFVYFWKVHQPGGFLSQWYRSDFEDEKGNEFISAEQYMMWGKAKLFEDEKYARLILAETNQKKIKALGRKVRNFDNRVWKRSRESIVYIGNKFKFEQNPELKEQLMSYDNPVFVEASPMDRIWGIGFGATNAPHRMDRWGLNLLGKTLTQLHRDFLSGDADTTAGILMEDTL